MPTEPTLAKVVIIGGMPRSGTNLARRLVGSHSHIAMAPVEFNFFGKLAAGWDIAKILAEPKFRERYPLEADDLVGREAAEVYRTLLSRYATDIGKPIAGEKSPRNEFFYRQILETLPGSDVRFVHMVRNPFDVIASYKNAPFRGLNPDNDEHTIASVAQEWVRSASLAAARSLTLPQRYRMVLFETMTENPDETVRQICAFLELDVQLKRMRELADFDGFGDNTSFKKPKHERPKNAPKIKQLESRKGHLTDKEIETVAQICGEIAMALGYEDPDLIARSCPAGPSATPQGYLSRISKRLGVASGR